MERPFIEPLANANMLTYKRLPLLANQKLFYSGLWCNGNTIDFDSIVLGSSPDNPTLKAAVAEW